jgi:hypothetical protein
MDNIDSDNERSHDDSSILKSPSLKFIIGSPFKTSNKRGKKNPFKGK